MIDILTNIVQGTAVVTASVLFVYLLFRLLFMAFFRSLRDHHKTLKEYNNGYQKKEEPRQ